MLFFATCIWVLPLVQGACPTLYGSSGIDLEGVRLYLDLNDEELENVPLALRILSNSDGTLDVVQNGLVKDVFRDKEFVQSVAPPILGSVKTIPMHIQSTKKLYYSLSIISENETVLGQFVNVTPNNVAVSSDSIGNLAINFCCRENATVLLEGCLSVSDESFELLNGAYSTLTPFYARYECIMTPSEVSSIQCPPSLKSSSIIVDLCFTRNQTLELVLSGDDGWGLLGGVIDENFCGITASPGAFHSFILNEIVSRTLPIGPQFQSLDFYFNRSESLYNWLSPTYYSLLYVPRNNTVVGLVNFSIPSQGTFEQNILMFTTFFSCLGNGESLIDAQFNTSGVIDGNVVSNNFSFYFYKICMPFNSTSSTEKTTLTNKILSISISVSIIVIIATVIVVLALMILITKRQKRHVQHLEQLAATQAASNEYAFASTYNPFNFLEGENIEYNYAAIEVVDKLGEGYFGTVYKAQAPGICRGEQVGGEFVAVKTLKNNSDPNSLNDFAKEMKVCLQFDHPNVVKLLGVCTDSVEKCMIFEFMDMGSLDNCLRASNLSDEEFDPSRVHVTPETFLPIVLQLGRALEYLSSLQFVHRDIATRNCLLNVQLTAKIADFGLSRNISAVNYYRIGGGKKSYLPIRWMPPEALLYGKYTLKSDVWSFGILMWEVYTFGQLPYIGLSNHEVIDFIKEHRVLSQPELSPLGVYDIMRSCWIRIPSQRATISEVVHHLELFSRGEVHEKGNYINLLPNIDKK